MALGNVSHKVQNPFLIIFLLNYLKNKKLILIVLQWRMPVPGLIVHSDQGGQYVAEQLKKLLNDYQCQQSMTGPPGRKGNCYDNAFAESFYSRFKTELLEGGAFLTIEDARTEIFDRSGGRFIEMYYNRKRRHSSIGNKSPLDFEIEFYLSLTNNLLN